MDQSELSEQEKLCYPTSGQLLAMKGPENHLKDFVATFLSRNFGTKNGLPARGDSNVSYCPLTFICAVSNYFKTNSV